MMRALAGIGIIVLLPFVAVRATGAAASAFDAADIHLSPRSDWVKDSTHPMQGGFLTADRYELRRATMLDLIRLAYNVDADKIAGGPSWLDYDRFDITSKTKPGARPEALRLMLQSLLADRFGLRVKSGMQQAPGYLLTRGKRELKLRPATDAATPAGCQSSRPAFDGGVASYTIQCHNITMDAFAQSLRRMVSGPLGNLPVEDKTSLEGGWDLDLSYYQRPLSLNGPAPDGPADAGVLDGIDKLGLKLELGKVPQPVLAVESVNEKPSPNPPDLAASLPPLPPPEFEVAAIQWPCVGNMSSNTRFEPGGRVTATCMSLLSLIKDAWKLPPFGDPPGAPKWLTENSTVHNISINAKAPAGFAIDPQHNLQARDLLNTMLRTLLMERYQMKFHYEDRPMDAGALAAVKPRLTKADPAGRTGCSRQGQEQQGRALMVKLACKNMTMAQFAEQIPAYDTDFYYPVLDATGIDGAWDFTINYDAMARL